MSHNHVKDKLNARQKTLIEGAFVKLVNRVDTSLERQIFEDDLVRTDSNDGSIAIEKMMVYFALLKAQDVCCDPQV